MKLLNSPYIVKLYEYFEINNHSFIVMEYCNEGTLDDKIN